MTSDHSKLRLRTDVRLTPLQQDHAPAMYRWMCDLTVRENIGLVKEPSLQYTRAWINNTFEDSSFRAYAVLCDDRHVGNVVLDLIDKHLSKARLSVYIGEEKARGCGVGTTSTYQVLREGFYTLNLHKIWLTVHSNNLNAISSYSRLGFLLEGTLRDEFLLQGERISALYMGMLKKEFDLIQIGLTSI